MQVSNTLFRNFFYFFLLLLPSFSFAQTLTGIVTDNEKEPLSGASILLKGTHKGVVTDEKGQFSLDVPAGTHTIEVHFLGYNTLEKQVKVAVGQKLPLSLTLQQETVEVKGITIQAYSPIKQVEKSAYNVVECGSYRC